MGESVWLVMRGYRAGWRGAGLQVVGAYTHQIRAEAEAVAVSARQGYPAVVIRSDLNKPAPCDLHSS